MSYRDSIYSINVYRKRFRYYNYISFTNQTDIKRVYSYETVQKDNQNYQNINVEDPKDSCVRFWMFICIK